MKLRILIILCLSLMTVQNNRVTGQDTGGYTFPVWSPDGESIAFASINNRGYQIILLEDNTVKSLTGEANEGFVESIEWSPDGNYLVYTVVGEDDINIWIAPILEGESYNLTENIAGNSRNPSWSGDSAHITFTNISVDGALLSPSQLWIIDIETLDATQLTPDDVCATDPHWIMDDNAIVFISIACPDEEGLYRYDFSSNEIVRISDRRIFHYDVSPSEEYFAALAWQSDSFILEDLILIGDETSENLATGWSFLFDISWSPDEEYLALSVGCDNGFKIVTLKIENLLWSDVTTCADGVFSSSPLWSPDSSAIIYRSDDDIWLYDLETQEYSNLTEDL